MRVYKSTTLNQIFLSIFIAALFLFGGTLTVAAGTFTVDTLADDGTKAACTAAPDDCSLRGAIFQANAQSSNDVINFSVTGVINLSTELPALVANSANGSVSVNGPGPRLLTVRRNSAAEFNIFTSVGSFPVGIHGITISGGASTFGGGIENYARLTISNCVISENTASLSGGGILNDQGGVLALVNSTVSGNSAVGEGGGIFNRQATVNLTNVTISGNSSRSNGGGISNLLGTFQASNSTIVANRADADGNNSGSGGGIAAYEDETLRSTIVAGNFRGTGIVENDVFHFVDFASFSLVGDAASALGVTNGVDGNMVGVDSKLGPLQYNGGPTKTHALLLGSPAINAGSNPGNLATDQRGSGFDRIFGGSADIGAFEAQPMCDGASFGGADNFAVADRPISVVTGDFNGDGMTDLATANLVSANISVLIGNGNGAFVPAGNYAAAPGTNSITTGDFNNDGRIDLVTTNWIADNFSVFTGNGDGTFLPAVNHATGDNPNSIATGDFNGDGRTDLAVANYSPYRISVRLGNGDSTFATAGQYPVGDGPGSVTTGDFNGDGKTDIATANVLSDNTSVLTGNGDGTFLPAVHYAVGDSPTEVTTGDFNGDGRTDLAAANYVSNTFSILLGNGDTTFAPALNYAAGIASTAVTTGDFNGDGRTDLAVTNQNSHIISVRLGNGDGTFAATVNYAVGGGPASITSGDFNGDGRTDLAAANGLSDSVSVLLNGCSPNTAPTAAGDSYSAEEDTPLAGSSVLANDSDGEGDTLAAVLVSGPVDAEAFSLNTDGTFSYTPTANSNGVDFFTYKASDGLLESEVVTVTIIVVPINDAPTISANAISRQQAAGSSNSSIATVGDIDNTAGDLVVTVDGGASATANGVTVSNISIDGSGNVTADASAACGASSATFSLKVSDFEGRFANATLNVTVTDETTAPVIDPISNVTVYLPANSPASSMVVNFPLPTATDNCSTPVVTTSPVSGSVFGIGTTTVNVTVEDAVGNTSSASFTVTVLYNFIGFLQPVDPMPVLNIARAGSSIPVKFSLSGNKGLGILAAGYPVSAPIACSENEPGNQLEVTDNTGSSVLTYDSVSDQYKYVWQTNKLWKGTCRLLIVKLSDESEHFAKFQFK